MAEIINYLKNYQQFIIPFCIVIITQFTKVILETLKNGHFKTSYLGSYGGMPSAHTALFISLSTIILYINGWSSPIFAVTLIISFIMIRDALGFRRKLGLGHTPLQVLVGAIIGFLLTSIFYLLIN